MIMNAKIYVEIGNSEIESSEKKTKKMNSHLQLFFHFRQNVIFDYKFQNAFYWTS